jgi:hypothetical protein
LARNKQEKEVSHDKMGSFKQTKKFGGLGFLDVRAMDVCLLATWIDRIERGDPSLCCELLRKKYLGQRSIFQVKNRSGSQFWRSLLDARVIPKRTCGQDQSWAAKQVFGMIWLSNCPQKVRFPNLFKISSRPDLTVARAVDNGQ